MPPAPSPRILHITARADHSGGPRHVFELVRELRPAAENWIACPREAPFWERFAALVGEERLLEIPHRALRMETFGQLRNTVRANRIAILHSHGRGGGIYARLLSRWMGAPCVHTFHGFFAQAKWRIWEERLLSRWNAASIAVSPGEADRLMEFSALRDYPDVIVNGVSVPDKCLPPRAQLQRVVGMMRIAPEKAPNVFVDVARMVPQLEFTLFGSGPLLDEIRAQAPANLKLPGPVDEPRDHMNPETDILLSTAPMEGMGMAALDAMAMGLPIVASNVMGNADLVRDGQNGFLYPFGDARAAAECIHRLRNDPALRYRLSRAGWETVRDNFNARLMAERTLAVYRAQLERSPLLPEL